MLTDSGGFQVCVYLCVCICVCVCVCVCVCERERERERERECVYAYCALVSLPLLKARCVWCMLLNRTARFTVGEAYNNHLYMVSVLVSVLCASVDFRELRHHWCCMHATL